MIAFLKMLADFVIPVGAEAIMAGITSQAVRNCGKLTKLAAGCTSIAVGWMIGDKTVEYFDKIIDEHKEKMDKYHLGSEG